MEHNLKKTVVESMVQPENIAATIESSVSTDGWSEVAESGESRGSENPTYAEVLEMIDRRIASLQIYIVESDITQAQNAVRAVVSEASF